MKSGTGYVGSFHRKLAHFLHAFNTCSIGSPSDELSPSIVPSLEEMGGETPRPSSCWGARLCPKLDCRFSATCKPRVSPLVQLFQICTRVDDQLMGIVLPS